MTTELDQRKLSTPRVAIFCMFWARFEVICNSIVGVVILLELKKKVDSDHQETRFFYSEGHEERKMKVVMWSVLLSLILFRAFVSLCFWICLSD